VCLEVSPIAVSLEGDQLLRASRFVQGWDQISYKAETSYSLLPRSKICKAILKSMYQFKLGSTFREILSLNPYNSRTLSPTYPELFDHASHHHLQNLPQNALIRRGHGQLHQDILDKVLAWAVILDHGTNALSPLVRPCGPARANAVCIN
jgi:hypothetical protein